METKLASIVSHFSELEDPRVDRSKEHSLEKINTIAICSILCGGDSFQAMEEFGKAKFNWLKELISLENGIPSHDTFGRVFSLIDSKQFQECFCNWVKSISKITSGEIVALDGKSLRHSYDKSSSKSAIHMVSAWASENGLVIGQQKVDKKSNEITAIPELLEMLVIKGCIVTIDAMGCQKKIVEKIVSKSADYVLSLKKNQLNLFKQVESYFESHLDIGFPGLDYPFHMTEENSHGRKEIREYYQITDLSWLEGREGWSELNSVGLCISERYDGNKFIWEKRYFISSLKGDIEKFGRAVRSHWRIENSLHWVLDVTFREDDSRVRKDNSSENFALLRHVALNLIKLDKSKKGSIKTKRLRAGWDEKYLSKLLN